MKGELVGLLVIVLVIFMLTRRSSFDETEFNSYVINLNSRDDRMNNFTDQWSKTDLGKKTNFTRVEADEGKTMDDVALDKSLGVHFVEMTGIRPSHDFLTRGMVGCYKSHYKAFEEIVVSNKPYGLIFEDDAEISNDIYDRLSGLEFPPSWDVILLGNVERIDDEPGPPGFRKVNYFMGLQGYLISQRGVQKMLSYKNTPINLQIDAFMSKLIKDGELEVFITEQLLVGQGGFGTDIQMLVMG